MAPKRKAGGSSASVAVDLSELLSRLNLASSSDDYDRVVDISNEILKSSPTDSRAAREKIAALIKLDKYKDALEFIQASTFLDSHDTILERGFCLYKLGKGDEAQKVLEEGSGRAVQHIRAQNVPVSYNYLS
jgi:tetratricopeptide (TPR) repeat protein